MPDHILRDLKTINKRLDEKKCPHCGQPVFNNQKPTQETKR